MNYAQAKAAAIDVLDDFTKLDIKSGYGGKYKATTKLDTIGIVDVIRAVMPHRTNKVFSTASRAWSNVGSIDLIQCSTISAFIKLVCAHATIAVPAGEPK
jgi:hypothetical protein